MVVLEKYYDIVEKPSSEFSKSWKICHIIFYMIAAVTGFISYYVFNSLKQQFGDNCILYANVSFLTKNITNESVNISKVIIDESKTVWGNDELCNFCQYVPIMSMIVAAVFLTFFCICPRGGTRDSQTGINQAWHLVLPSLTLTTVFTFIFIASTIMTKNGINAFCEAFQSQLNTTSCTKELEKFALKIPTFHSNTLTYINTLMTLLIICGISWILSLSLLLFRCCCAMADFKILEITISKVDEDIENSVEETEILLEPKPLSSQLSHV